MAGKKTSGRNGEAPPGTQAVVRAVHLLKTIARAPGGVGLAELCDEVVLSKPTVHRMLSALISEGLVAQDPATRSFRLGPEAIAFGAHSAHRPDLRSLARPFLESLAAEARETATLEIPLGQDMLILDEVDGGHIIGARTEVGTRWPFHATSTGKAVLARLPLDELESWLKDLKEQVAPSTMTDPEKLRAVLLSVRKNGYAMAVGELQPDFSAVGAAVSDSRGATVAAMSLGGPSERLPRKRLRVLGQMVRGAADDLSRLLLSS